MTVNWSRRKLTSMFFRLCSRAPRISMAGGAAECAGRTSASCTASKLRRGLQRFAQRASGVRGAHAHDAGRRTDADHGAARLASLGAQVDDPIGRAHHVQVVFDDQQRVAGLDQPPEGAQQFRDVVEVQAGGRLVEQKQRTARERGAALAHRILRQMAGELQPLRLPAREGGHGLAESQVVEPDFRERREAQAHLGVGAKHRQRLGNRELEDIGDAQSGAKPPRDSLHSRISAR